jgi:tetratricopeptide (TPR) repeat protein
MTRILPTTSTHVRAPRSLEAHARALLAVLLLATPALTGCGIKFLGGAPGGKTTTSVPKVQGSSLVEQIADAREQAALAPGEPYWPYRIGQLMVGADSTVRAEAELRNALARDPNYAPALSLLSRLYYDAKRHQDGVRLIEEARARPQAFPDGVPPALLAGLALHYDALDRPDLAQQVLSNLGRPDPRGLGPAVVYLQLRGDKPETATDLAAASVAENSKSAASQNNYGITRLRAGDPESAKRAFLKAIDLDPKRAGPYYNLAILEKFYLLDDQAATGWFAKYWERSQNDPDAIAGVVGGRVAGKREER